MLYMVPGNDRLPADGIQALEVVGQSRIGSYGGVDVNIDPKLALVRLRMEIERMLHRIAREQGIDQTKVSAGILLRELLKAGVLSPNLAAGFGELVDYGNQAAHGVSVSPAAADWALEVAPEILNALTDYLGD